MRARSRLPYVVLSVVVFVALSVGYWLRPSRGGGDAAVASPRGDEPHASRVAAGAAGRRRLALPPMIPIPPPPVPDEAVGDPGPSGPSRPERDETARQERALMAKTWGFTEDQLQRFE